MRLSGPGTAPAEVTRAFGGVLPTIATFATLAGLVLLIVALTWVRRALTRRRMASWAADRRWQVSSDTRPWRLLVHRLNPRAVPHAPVVSGEWNGRQFAVLPARAGDATGNQAEYAIVAVRVPAALPPLTLHPRSRATDFAGAVGGRLRTGHARLDQRYRLRSTDPATALWLLRSRLADLLLLAEPVPIAISPPWIATSARTRRVPDDAERLLPLITWLAGEFEDAARGPRTAPDRPLHPIGRTAGPRHGP